MKKYSTITCGSKAPCSVSTFALFFLFAFLAYVLPIIVLILQQKKYIHTGYLLVFSLLPDIALVMDDFGVVSPLALLAILILVSHIYMIARHIEYNLYGKVISLKKEIGIMVLYALLFLCLSWAGSIVLLVCVFGGCSSGTPTILIITLLGLAALPIFITHHLNNLKSKKRDRKDLKALFSFSYNKRLMMKHITWFKDITKDSILIAGGKGANLGEMYNLGLPVPPGFCVTADTYKEYLERTGTKQKIERLLQGLEVEDTTQLQDVAARIQNLIVSTPIPEDIAEEIRDSYELLGADKQAHDLVQAKEVFVAVRSSATAEDLPSISAEEHILLTVNGKPFYRKMKDLQWIDPEKDIIEIPALEDNQIKWKKVSSLYRHPATKEILYKITTTTGREVTISPEHSLIILDETNLQLKIAKVHELKGKEKVPAISVLPEINNKDTFLDVLDYVQGDDIIEKNGLLLIKNNSSNWTIQHPLSRKMEFSPDFAYFLGIYVAEGSTYKNNHVLITNSDPAIQQRIISYLRSIHLYDNQKINKHTIRVYCKTLVRFLHAVAGEPSSITGKGKLSSVKKVPEFVFGWNAQLRGEFLKGAFDGDGGIENKGIGYCSTSPLLIGGIIKVLEVFGIEFMLHGRKGKQEQWRDYQQIHIPARETLKFKEKIYFESPTKQKKLNRCIQEFISIAKAPQFKHTFNVNKTISKSIKQKYNAELPKEIVKVCYCPQCNIAIGKTSDYKEKERYYCSGCSKAYYEKQVIRKNEEKYIYYDDKGHFKKGMVPWNRGNLQGKLSQHTFSKEMKELGLKDYADFFSGTVRWDEIKVIEEIPYTGYVYDFTVPDVENFAAGVGGIITHNSASFAGQQATFLNIKGKDNCVGAVLACWASLFTARAMYYREKKKFSHMKVYISAVVQKMVNADRSGIMFTVNPATNKENELVIEAVYGLGEAIVGGEVNPNLYIVDKKSRAFRKKEIKKQDYGLFRNEKGENEKRVISKLEQERQIVPDAQLLELARLGMKLEAHYQKAQDIEWAIENGTVYIVQTRAITTLKSAVKEEAAVEETGRILLKGETAAAGVYSGPVRLVKDPSELNKVLKGDILVTRMTTPDMVPAMERAGAIVTDEGGLTCHAAIVSREMGTPCIVGTEHATEVLKDGQLITVQATKGIVYAGKVEAQEKPKIVAAVSRGEDIITATAIKVILDLPDFAQRAAATGADGVGLIRSEIMIANGGIHPAEYIRQGREGEYVKLLQEGVGKIAKAFAHRPVWMRCSDMRSDEYRNLQGGEKEPKETDPMIGWHGIRRLLDEEKILKAEFQALRELHYQGLKNVGVIAAGEGNHAGSGIGTDEEYYVWHHGRNAGGLLDY